MSTQKSEVMPCEDEIGSFTVCRSVYCADLLEEGPLRAILPLSHPSAAVSFMCRSSLRPEPVLEEKTQKFSRTSNTSAVQLNFDENVLKIPRKSYQSKPQQ